MLVLNDMLQEFLLLLRCQKRKLQPNCVYLLLILNAISAVFLNTLLTKILCKALENEYIFDHIMVEYFFVIKMSYLIHFFTFLTFYIFFLHF